MKKNFTLVFLLLFAFWDLSITGQTLDYGDAPDPTYPTFLASNGARHTASGPRLGSLRDTEANGQPNGTATGDDNNPLGSDDEDGIWWPFNFVPGHGNTIRVTVSGGTAYLSAWMDFNIDGDWADAGEKIFKISFSTQALPIFQCWFLQVLTLEIPSPGLDLVRFKV
ncbi:MAG: hypothetical protein FJY07_01675 [Bacteroidetes bacterium]|nr:hypothetical protein [Bacteroidota bacterium]